MFDNRANGPMLRASTQRKGNDSMTDYVAIHRDNALAFLTQCGVPGGITRDVLRSIRPASKAFGSSYYFPDDLEAAANCYLDGLEG